MSDSHTAKVRKTKYHAPKAERTEEITHGHIRRSVTDFPTIRHNPPLAHRQLGQQVKLLVPLPDTRSKFPIAVPGEYGSYQGQRTGHDGQADLCAVKFAHGTAFLPETSLEWIE